MSAPAPAATPVAPPSRRAVRGGAPATPQAGRANRPPRPGGVPRGAVVADVVVLVLALALALLPLVPVYGGAALVRPVAGGLVLGATLGVVAGLRRWGALVTAAAALGLHLLAGPALATPTAAFAGVLPSPDAVRLLLTGVVDVWKHVLTLEPQLGSAGHVLVAPFLLALGGAVVAVTAAVRGRTGPRSGGPLLALSGSAESSAAPRGTWAAVVPVLVLATAVLLGTKESVRPAAAGVVLALVLLLWASWRRGALAPRRLVALAAVLAVPAVVGTQSGPVVGEDRPRHVVRDEIVPPFDPRDHPSPLSRFRAFHKDDAETELLTVRGLPEGASVRLATMDAFDGVVWNVAGAEAAAGSGEFRRVGETITTSVPGDEAVVDLEVHELPSVWLPTVGWTQEVDFTGSDALGLAADLRYNDATGTAVLTEGVPDGTRWTTRVVVPSTPEDEEIGDARAADVPLPAPTGVPDAVPVYAGDLAGTASSPLLIARTLEASLRDQGFFSHGIEESGDWPSLSGHGADRVTTLLTGELMVGDSEQYASAMALMAREMGLPARVVLGFTPDEDEVGADQITFTGADVEAWVEIALDGVGWVEFRPTPDESRTPDTREPEDEAEPQPRLRQPPPPPQDPVVPPDDDTEQPRTRDTLEEIEEVRDWRPVILAAAAVVVPLLLLLVPLALIAAAKARRRRRRRAAPDPVGRVVGGWEEVLDEARDLRRPAPPTATRREIAVRLTAAFAAGTGRSPAEPAVAARRAQLVGAPMAGLAAGADAVVFGAGEPTDEQVRAYWSQVEATVAAMRSAVPRRRRLLGRFTTASLRTRRRQARADRRAARERAAQERAATRERERATRVSASSSLPPAVETVTIDPLERARR